MGHVPAVVGPMGALKINSHPSHKASFDACDAAWAAMTDDVAMQTIAGRGGATRTKITALIGNTTHNTEMYGYISVYMRLKGVVPPTSDRGPM